MYDNLTAEQSAFIARLNVHAKGAKGVNERYGCDSFLAGVCAPLASVFEAHGPDDPAEDLNRIVKTYSRHRQKDKLNNSKS